jgi:hypothetical protein
MANTANMTFRALTPTGDWIFGNGLGAYASQQQAIALNIQTSVLMWAGDCFFALNGNGLVPWINWLGLMNTGNQARLNAALQTLLSGCYGVMSVQSAVVNVNRFTRQFTASYTVTTIYSQQVTNVVQILSGQQQLVIT